MIYKHLFKDAQLNCYCEDFGRPYLVWSRNSGHQFILAYPAITKECLQYIYRAATFMLVSDGTPSLATASKVIGLKHLSLIRHLVLRGTSYLTEKLGLNLLP